MNYTILIGFDNLSDSELNAIQQNLFKTDRTLKVKVYPFGYFPVTEKLQQQSKIVKIAILDCNNKDFELNNIKKVDFSILFNAMYDKMSFPEILDIDIVRVNNLHAVKMITMNEILKYHPDHLGEWFAFDELTPDGLRDLKRKIEKLKAFYR